MRLKGVDCLLRGFDGVVVGRSAGAAALGLRCIITTRIDGKRVFVTVPGFGLVDFCVKTHYKPLKDRQLKQLSHIGRVFGVPEGSALVFKDGVLGAIGEVYLFEDGEKTKFE
jgi:hypothetical protein